MATNDCIHLMKYYGFCRDIIHINLEHNYHLQKLWSHGFDRISKYQFEIYTGYSINYYGFCIFLVTSWSLRSSLPHVTRLRPQDGHQWWPVGSDDGSRWKMWLLNLMNIYGLLMVMLTADRINLSEAVC